jgi:hypothetical protein
MGEMKPGTAEYVAFHKRLCKIFGSAKLWPCVDCGNPAYDWCHEHNTNQYDPINYRPRCRSHHFKYDMNDQWKDRISNGLAGIRNGEQVNTSTLTVDKVLEIRRLLDTKLYSQTELACMFSVTQTCISKILLRKTWHHV